ncbi:MAG: hypothetical protein P1P65_04715 [Treponema sp.]
MKKIVYPSCYLFLCVIVLFFTSCSTVEAGKKAPDVPEQEERSAAVYPQNSSGAADRTAPAEKPAKKTDTAAGVSVKPVQAAEKPAQRKSGTVQSAGGAPAASRKVPQSRKPAGLSPVQAQDADLSAADLLGEPVNAPAAPVPREAAQLPPQPVAKPPKSIIPLTPLVPAAAPILAASAEEIAPQEAATERAALSSDELAPPVQQAAAELPARQTYETSLAALISDFEDQGGSHGYEPPRTFHEEMLDLFSPHIFSVALSKEPETEQKVSVSRSAAVEEKQRLEIVYPGHGWVYVGEQTAQQGLRYEQRKLQGNTSIFTFSAEKTGQYVLHFSYFDVFSDDFITDAVAVWVGAAKSSGAKTTVRAPEYKSKPPADEEAPVTGTEGEAKNGLQHYDPAERPETAEAIAEKRGMAEAAGMETGGRAAVPPAASEKEANALAPEDLLKKARAALSSADAPAALEALDLFFARSAKNIDEGWFLRGRAYELNGPARNIRLALDSYKTVTEAFPQSKYWAAADARIRYITGFYINIR